MKTKIYAFDGMLAFFSYVLSHSLVRNYQPDIVKNKNKKYSNHKYENIVALALI